MASLNGEDETHPSERCSQLLGEERSSRQSSALHQQVQYCNSKAHRGRLLRTLSSGRQQRKPCQSEIMSIDCLTHNICAAFRLICRGDIAYGDTLAQCASWIPGGTQASDVPYLARRDAKSLSLFQLCNMCRPDGDHALQVGGQRN